MDVMVLRALASEKRLQILEWLKAPRSHFREQVDGDLVEDGVCGLLIAEKLGIAPPTLSGHMRLLIETRLIRGKKIKQWVFYKRNEERLREVAATFADEL